MSRDPVTRGALALVMHGVPFDVAFALDPAEMLAWTVIIGEANGGRFDWDAMTWRHDD